MGKPWEFEKKTLSTNLITIKILHNIVVGIWEKISINQRVDWNCMQMFKRIKVYATLIDVIGTCIIFLSTKMHWNCLPIVEKIQQNKKRQFQFFH